MTASPERCAGAHRAWNLIGPEGLRIRVLGLGATWVSCQLPLDSGRRELLLGCDSESDYLRQNSYLGACIGRYANRIAEGGLQTASGAIQLDRLAGEAHTLHGGPEGFDRRQWQLQGYAHDRLCLALHSPAGDQGFPGALDAEIRFRMLPEFGIEIETRARVSEPCPVNLTQHPYFNLDGKGDARRQRLLIHVQRFLPVDGAGIPIGGLQAVDQTRFDFRAPRTIAEPQTGESGDYDHAWLLHRSCGQIPTLAAALHSADARVRMSLYTTLSALQLYSGAHLAQGTCKSAPAWPNFSGVALEPQFLPDSPNHAEWPQPSCWLQPGALWRHRSIYRFSLPAR